MSARRQLQPVLRRLRRCLVVGLALLGYVTAILGVPLPARAPKVGGQPFPCQNHACGCVTAEQCWDHCCCYSLQEKLAWASARHVEPPAYVKVQADLGWSAPRQRDRREEKTATATSSCCCSGHAATQTSSKPKQSPPAAAAPAKSSGWVIGLSARHCRAESSLWTQGIPSLPPPAIITWNYEWAAGYWLEANDSTPACLFTPPPAPPPRG